VRIVTDGNALVNRQILMVKI